MTKTLLVSFVYPSISSYLKEFFMSLKRQSTDEFDTLIFNDCFKEDLTRYGYSGELIYNNFDFNIIESRKFMIDYAINNKYDLLIFADADDVMEFNRIEKVIEAYKKNNEISFFYNELYLLKDKSKDFFDNKLPIEIKTYKKILNYNFLGMSHNAININKENDLLLNMPLFSNIIAFDWYLYTYILINNGKGKKINTKTYYRIYNNNLAGETKFLNDKKLNFGIKVKKNHYSVMKKYNKIFKNKYREILKLEKFIQNENNKKAYINFINNNIQSVFWWEYIKTLSEVNKFNFK